MVRIAEFEGGRSNAGADGYSMREMLEDEEFVRRYEEEVEKRCANGVWWEGWLIVGELKRQGL